MDFMENHSGEKGTNKPMVKVKNNKKQSLILFGTSKEKHRAEGDFGLQIEESKVSGVGCQGRKTKKLKPEH